MPAQKRLFLLSSLLKRPKNLRSRLRAPKYVDASQGGSSQNSKTWKIGRRTPLRPHLHHASQRHIQAPRQIAASPVYRMSCKLRYLDMLLCPSTSSYLCMAQDTKIANPQPIYYRIYYDWALPNPWPLELDTKFLQCMYDALEARPRSYLALWACVLNSCLWWRQRHSRTLLAYGNMVQTCRLARLVGLQVWEELLEQIEIPVLNRGLGRWEE